MKRKRSGGDSENSDLEETEFLRNPDSAVTPSSLTVRQKQQQLEQPQAVISLPHQAQLAAVPDLARATGQP